MEETALATSMAALLLIATICTIIFKKMKMPAIIGYLATGIILANYWQTVNDETTHIVVELLSNLGLILLMFTIGMELNFEKLRKSGAFAALIVMIQVPIVLICGILFGNMLGWNFTLSIVMGAILAGSSTAVVLVVQREKRVLDPEAVDTLLLILVVEDVAQVIMMSILTPMLETASGTVDVQGIVILLAKIIIFMCVSTFIGIRFVPRMLDWIGDKTDREILILSALACCFILATLATGAGMSVAVGAFLMGVIISQCKFVEDINHNVEPMKDIFMAMFFVSIGLEVHPQEIIDNALLMIGIFFLFIISRAVAIYLGYFLGNKDCRYGFISATSLLTMGEFAFILSSLAYKAGVMSSGVQAAVIGAALISMVTQSFITGASGKVYDAVTSRMPGPISRMCHAISERRTVMYNGLGIMSANGIANIRKIITFAYCSGFAIIIIVMAFIYLGDNLIDFFYSFNGVNMEEAIRITNVIEFLLLLVPISLTIRNLKNILKYIMDPEERARGLVLTQKHDDYILGASNINLWIPTFAIDLLIMIIVPNHASFLEQFVITGIGIAIFVAIGFISYKRGIKKDSLKQ